MSVAGLAQSSGLYNEVEGMAASKTSQPLLLVTTVDIGEGKSDRIEVRRDDVPMDVARDFVIKHGLPPAIIPRLAMHLEENLEKVAAQKQAAQARGGRIGAGYGESDEEVAVFHRLYEQAVALRHKLDDKRDEVKRSELESIKHNKTAMSWISSEMMRDRSSGPFENYGEMLYAESLESMARKKEKTERRKTEKQMEEVAGVTFRPEISKLAQNLWTPQECAAVPAWQRLSRVKMTKAQERLELLRREKEEAEVKECTFKPQLNNRSEKLMTERSHTLRSLNVSAHQQLYQDAVRRQQKMQDYQHWYPEEVTFQPKLHESAMSKEFLRKSLGADGAAMLSATGEERHMALVNRLYASYEKLQNKLQDARSTLQTSVDPATGKRLFHPETGRAPKFTRNNGHLHVGEYLYSLKEQHDDKMRAATDEKERKRLADAAREKQSQGSKSMVKALLNKRFRQIFDFLDQEGLGSFNLVTLMNSVPEWLDDLDDEVRSDLEMAAKLLSKRTLKHNDSSKSDSSSFFMPPPPTMDVADDGSAVEGAEGSCPTTPNTTPGVVSFQQFCDVMEEVLTTRRGPRTYLAPSPPRKYVATETYKPQIDERSKQIAAKIRPKDTPLHEYLYQESTVINQRLNEMRARAEAERTQDCTFAPRLVSQQLVKEGRVMRGVRDGTWNQKNTGELEGVDSLQSLAALMVAEPSEPKATAAADAVERSCSSRSPAAPAFAAERSYNSRSPAPEQQEEELEPAVDSYAAHYAEQQQDQEEQQLLLQEMQEMQYRQAVIEEQQDQEEGQHEQGAELDDFEGSEEQRQYLELEREVQQMLEATSAAAAAAERLQSHSDQQYLSEILGLAQEQVDAMAPAISNLQGLQVRHSRNNSLFSSSEAAPSAAASATGATAAAAAVDYTPMSSFKVSMPNATEGAEAAAAPAGSPQRQQSGREGGQLRRQESNKAPGLSSRSSSKQLAALDEMDLFALAAGVTGGSPGGNIGAAMGRLAME